MADPVSLAITAALTAAQMALTMSQKITGPRLDSLDVSLSEYGTALPRFWGIRRFECPIIWAEKLHEEKVESKSKGGKYAEYKYYGTWAVAVADHEVDSISRIWFDRHLIVNMSGKGIIGAFAAKAADSGAIKLGFREHVRIYLGTETQEPDPRMEAWCEDQYGPDTCPGYRGVAYIVFRDIPLEKFGNRIPQVSVEAISNKTDAFLFDTLTSATSTGGFVFNAGWGVRFRTAGQLEWYDTGTRTVLGTSPSPGVFTGTVQSLALGLDGTAYCYGAPDSGELDLIVTPPLGVPAVAEVTDAESVFVGNVRVFGDNPYGAYDDHAGYLFGLAHVDHTLRARDFCIDRDNEVWGLFQPDASSDSFTIERFSDGASFTFSGAVVRSDVTSARFCVNEEGDFFVDGDDGHFYVISSDDGSIVTSGSAAWSQPAQLRAQSPSVASFWDVVDEYSTIDGAILQNNSISNWTSANVASWAYDPYTHAIWAGKSSSNDVIVRYLDRVANNGVMLRDVVGDVSDWCGIADYDYSDLDQTVYGYSVTQGAGKDMIAPLLDIHDSDLFPHDFDIKGLKRGLASDGTILTPDFVREGDEARYVVSITQDTDLPRKVTFNFADIGKDQQTNTVIAQRPLDSCDTVREQTIDLTTYVLSPADAQKLADRYFRRQWNSREIIQLGLSAQHLALEPTNVKTLSLDGTTRHAALRKLTLSQGVLKCEWVRDFAGLNDLGTGTGADMDGRDDDEIFAPAPTKGFVLDIPLAKDADSNSNPLLYYGAGSYGVGSWPGAVVYEGDGTGHNFTVWNAVESSDKAVWGIAMDALPTANPWLWDRGNTVNVKVFGTLSTVTEADIDANPLTNLAYLGGELLNFTTATLESDGSYTLSGFKRGRRGTEGWVSGHVAGDDFVLVSDLFNDNMGASDVGTHLYWKAQTFLRDAELAPTIEFDFAGNSLKPYAPARIKWSTDGTDLFGTIIRRTRVGGAWVGGSTIPLSENSEEYEVDVMDGADVLRTITVSGTNAFTYTAAQISADGGSVSVPPDVNVYQLSDAVGRGFALAA